MARYFTEKITKEVLEEKITKIAKAKAEREGDDYEKEGYSYQILNEQVMKDLNKVNFCSENSSAEKLYGNAIQPDGEKYLGYNTLDNGLSYLGVNAGGDWETPVFFMLYWDGKSIRGYVPKEGNTWNTLTKEAYGNDDDKDVQALKNLGLYDENGDELGREKLKYDFYKIIAEVKKHIIYKGK